LKTSVSTLRTWMSCPLKAKFKYIDGLPDPNNANAAYGNCIHDALEYYLNTLDVEAAVERFKQTWENPELLDLRIDIWLPRTSYGGFRESGINLIRAYHEKNMWDERKLVATEHKFCVPTGDHLLSGVVDFLEFKKDKKGERTLRISDFKTGKQPYQNQLTLDIQFTAYIYASLQPEFWLGFDDEKYLGFDDGQILFDTFAGVKRSAIWVNLNTGKEIDAGERDEKDFLRLYRCIEEVDKAMKAEVYVPNISGDSCNFCPYLEECCAVGPVADKIIKRSN